MSWQRATLYTAAHELSVWLERSTRHEPEGSALRACTTRAHAALGAIGVALSFPDRRRAALREADESLLHLRLLLRVAADAGRLSAGSLRFAAERLERMGRQLGGWQRALRDTARSRDSPDEPTASNPGEGSPR